MKVRHGFVSNSSASSFLCDVCGTIEAGLDIDITDAEMLRCQKRHTFCSSHMEGGNPIDIPRSLEEKKQILLNYAIFVEGGDIEDLYENWKLEACYEMPSELCPFCNLQRVTDDFLLLYLLKTMNTSRTEIVKQIREKHSTYDDFKNFVKPS